MFDRFGATNYNPNYTNEIIEEEELATGNGTLTSFEAFLAYTPVRPQTVVITSGGVTIADDGNGQLKGTGVTGTVDYESGKVTLTFTTAPTDGTTIDASYDYDLELIGA